MITQLHPFKKLLLGLLTVAMLVLVYQLSNAVYDYLLTEHAAALHGLFVGGGVFLMLLVWLIAFAEKKLLAHTRSWLAALLPLSFLLGLGLGLIVYGLSYWWGQAWKIAAGVCLVAGQLLVWAWNWVERRV